MPSASPVAVDVPGVDRDQHALLGDNAKLARGVWVGLARRLPAPHLLDRQETLDEISEPRAFEQPL